MYQVNENKLERAKKKVEKIKGFYIHAMVYTVINAFILINIFINTDHFWQFEHFTTAFFWGVGLVFHGFNVFGFNPLFSKDWEERQIKKYMDRDRKNTSEFF